MSPILFCTSCDLECQDWSSLSSGGTCPAGSARPLGEKSPRRIAAIPRPRDHAPYRNEVFHERLVSIGTLIGIRTCVKSRNPLFWLRFIVTSRLTVTICAGKSIASPATKDYSSRYCHWFRLPHRLPKSFRLSWATESSPSPPKARICVISSKCWRLIILLSPTIIQEAPNAEGNLSLAMGVVAHTQKCQFVNLRMMFLHALEARPLETKRWLKTAGIHMQPLGSALMALGVLRALGVPDAKTAATAIIASTK